MGFTKWEWDASRHDYYYHDPDENCYVYEKTGLKIPVPGRGTSDQGTTQELVFQNDAPATHYNRPLTGESDGSVLSRFSSLSLNGSIGSADGSNEASGRYESGTGWPYGSSANPTPQNPGWYNASAGYARHGSVQTTSYAMPARTRYSVSLPHGTLPGGDQFTNTYTSRSGNWNQPRNDQNQGTYQNTSYSSHDQRGTNWTGSSQAASMNRDYSQLSDREKLQQVDRNTDQPPSRATIESTQPELLRFGITPHRHFKGTFGNVEKLDPSFQIRYPGYEFFKKGRVFRILWPELAGDTTQNITIATTPRFGGEKFFVKVRWFVVVREGNDCCTCLSIQTYGNRGIPKNKVKNHHAIMYTGDTPPEPLPSERPRSAGELPMGDPIRVIGTKPFHSKMDPRSRVNFLKIYTVEHNVKVDDFGYVDKNDEWKLITQFNSHWKIRGDEYLPSATRRPQSQRSNSMSTIERSTAQVLTPYGYPARADRYDQVLDSSTITTIPEDRTSSHESPVPRGNIHQSYAEEELRDETYRKYYSGNTKYPITMRKSSQSSDRSTGLRKKRHGYDIDFGAKLTTLTPTHSLDTKPRVLIPKLGIEGSQEQAHAGVPNTVPQTKEVASPGSATVTNAIVDESAIETAIARKLSESVQIAGPNTEFTKPELLYNSEVPEGSQDKVEPTQDEKARDPITKTASIDRSSSLWSSEDSYAFSQASTNSDKGNWRTAMRDHAQALPNLLKELGNSCSGNEQQLSREQLEQFNLWASSAGVFAANSTCLDYRLRGDPKICRLVQDMLKVLRMRIVKAIRACDSTQSSENVREDASSVQSPSLSPDEDLNTAKRQISNATSNLSSAIGAVRKTIQRLHQLSSTVLDTNCGLDFPSYTRADNLRSPADTSQHALEHKEAICRFKEVVAGLLYDKYSCMSKDQLRMLTDISSLRRRQLINWANDRESAFPYRTGISSEQVLPAPPSTEENSEEQECPYCFWVFPKDYFADNQLWKAHLEEDLKPYVCLHEDCLEEPLAFTSITSWARHANEIHAVKWICPLKHKPNTEVFIFEKEIDLEQHLMMGHERLNESKIDILLRRGKMAGKADMFESCPFCTKLENKASIEDMEEHIGGHLFDVALLALPKL